MPDVDAQDEQNQALSDAFTRLGELNEQLMSDNYDARKKPRVAARNWWTN